MSNFDKALEDRGITHYFSHPNCPKENSRVERKIQTTASELWNYRTGYDIKEINEIVCEWNETYDDIRPHQSLGYLTPNEFLSSWYVSSKHKEHMPTCTEPAQKFALSLKKEYNLLLKSVPPKGGYVFCVSKCRVSLLFIDLFLWLELKFGFDLLKILSVNDVFHIVSTFKRKAR